MGGTFEQQLLSLVTTVKEEIGGLLNVPSGTTGNKMYRPEMTVAESLEYQRRHQAAAAALRAAGGYETDRARHWAEAQARQQAHMTGKTYNGGGHGGGGGGGGNGNGVWTDPKLIWAGGLALILFFMYRKQKK